jgi:hypothetical protein
MRVLVANFPVLGPPERRFSDGFAAISSISISILGCARMRKIIREASDLDKLQIGT